LKWPSEEDEDGMCGYIKSDSAQESRNHAQISERMAVNMARVMITSEDFGTKYILFQNWGHVFTPNFGMNHGNMESKGMSGGRVARRIGS